MVLPPDIMHPFHYYLLLYTVGNALTNTEVEERGFVLQELIDW